MFQDDHDRDNFLQRLSTIVTETRTACCAWALIPNHFHLLLKTGETPIATVMRRLLTGYAVSCNPRHHRHGHLFQNRYKSILCQEDAYFLELVRYIHLNPLRAKVVASLEALDTYRFSGHSRLVGHIADAWQAQAEVLALFAKRLPTSRKRYRAFVEKGIAMGKRPELTGGGPTRSAGGGQELKALRKKGVHLKSDERILSESDFVGRVLQHQDEASGRRYRLKALGYDFDKVIVRVAELFDMRPDEVLYIGKQPRRVQARSLACYWAVNELGLNATEGGRRLGLSQSALSRAVPRGAQLAVEKQYSIEAGNA